ncbi:single-stranded-DNA-specific exonuclease RecJ [bacterium]|nr:single-stranded-DNA-specific exonuclease RecJ [bacterium]
MNWPIKKWVLKRPDKKIVEKIADKLNISPVIARILVNRGVKTIKEANDFINPDILDIYSPFLLTDMEKAVERIKKAIKNKEKILIYGDRDVDGITSVGIVKKFIDGVGGKTVYYIPSEEGYGIFKNILEKYSHEGISLIITVDCGINAIEEVSYAKSLGMEVIITDHHQPLEILPSDALAIINPKRENSSYPFKSIAGSTVAFKLCQAFLYSNGKEYIKELIAIAVKKNDSSLQAGEGENFEIGAVKLKNGLTVDTFNGKYEKGKISSNKMVENFLDFIKEKPLIVYNETENFKFLKEQIEKMSAKKIKNQIVDVLKMSYAHPQLKSDDLIFSPEKLVNTNLKTDVQKHSMLEEHNSLTDALSIAGMFYKLFSISNFRMNFFIKEYVDLVALGLVADHMPLIDENRIILKYGLKRIKRTKKKGLKAILEKWNIDDIPTIEDISWYIAPFLNAAGRMGQGHLGVELILTNKPEEVQALLTKINDLNEKRKKLQKKSLEYVMKLLPQQCDINKDKVLVISVDDLDRGIISIISSRIFREYDRPVIILSIVGEEARGSARSIDSFDLTRAFGKCSSLLIRYGGHKKAAGLTIAVDNIAKFKEKIKKIAEETISHETLGAKLEIDAKIDISLATREFVKEINQLGPYGADNPSPVFSIENIPVKKCIGKKISKNHLFLKIENNGKKIDVVGWKMGSKKEVFSQVDFVDFAFQLELNKWQEKESVRMRLEDIKPSQRMLNQQG